MYYLTPDHVVTTVERTFLFVVRRPPTPAVIASLEARALAAARVHRGGMAYMHVVLDLPSTGKVDDATRTAYMAMARRTGHLLSGAAMVLMRDGFAGAAMRAGVSGALLLLKPSFPVRVFSTVAAAAQWIGPLQSKSGVSRDAAVLERAVAALEAAMRRDFVP